MPGAVRRIGAALPDRDMTVFDFKTRVHATKEWSKIDRPFDLIRTPMLQRAGVTPASGDFSIPEYTPISDQGTAGTCVANGCCDAFEILDGIAHGPSHVQQLSRRWLYFISRHYHGAEKVDDGTFIRAALLQSQIVGTFEEKFFPYFDDAPHITGAQSVPELDLYMMASNNRLKGFYRLDPSSPTFLDDVELTVRALHPVIYSIQVGTEFEQYPGGNVILQPPATSLGGHCNIIVGVHYISGVRTWITRNSWSKLWGNQGHGFLSDTYMKTAEDPWVATTTLETIR